MPVQGGARAQAPPPPPTTPASSGSSRTRIWIAVGFAIAILIATATTATVMLWKPLQSTGTTASVAAAGTPSTAAAAATTVITTVPVVAAAKTTLPASGAYLPAPAGGKTVAVSAADLMRWSGKGKEKAKVAGGGLDITLKPGGYGSTGGIVLRSQLAQGAKEILVSFEVKFGSGPTFDFVRGGKASILGFEFGSGGSSGGAWSATAGSCRLMFRARGVPCAYVYYGKTGNDLKSMADQDPSYAKVAKATGTAGHDLWDIPATQLPPFRANTWHTVRLYGKMNSKGKGDGAVGMSVDGQSRLFSKMRWLDSPAGVSDLLANVWYGGSDASWSPKKDQVISFRNMKVTYA